MYMIIILKLNNLDLPTANDKRQQATVTQRIHRGPFNSASTPTNTVELSFKLGRNVKYNWSYTSQLNKDIRDINKVS